MSSLSPRPSPTRSVPGSNLNLASSTLSSLFQSANPNTSRVELPPLQLAEFHVAVPPGLARALRGSCVFKLLLLVKKELGTTLIGFKCQPYPPALSKRNMFRISFFLDGVSIFKEKIADFLKPKNPHHVTYHSGVKNTILVANELATALSARCPNTCD